MQPSVAAASDFAPGQPAFGHNRPLSGSIERVGRRTPSLFDSLFPTARTWHRIIAVVAMAGLVAGLAQARFYLPDNPVPITFQTFGVLLTGGVLGLRWGLASAVLYYLVGMAGVPVFQNGGNGWAYVAHGATGGYLLGFILATGLTGYLSERGWNRERSLWPMTISALLIYGPALIWLTVFDFGWPAEGKLFSSAMYPFIPGDVVKLLLAAVTVGVLWRVADGRVRHRQETHLNEGGNTER